MPLSSPFYSEEMEAQGGLDTGCCHRCPCRVSCLRTALPTPPACTASLLCPADGASPNGTLGGWSPWVGLGEGADLHGLPSLPACPRAGRFYRGAEMPGMPHSSASRTAACLPCPPGELGQPLLLQVSNPRPLLWSSQSSVALVPQLSVEWPAEASLHLVGGG